jgi:molybdate transport system substrate-binding protein
MRPAIHTLCALALAILAAACGPQPAPISNPGTGSTGASPQAAASPAPAIQGELRVFAAASLTDAFNELGRAFESQNPGSTVVFNFGPSTGLRTQIENGATADVYASADQTQMERARTGGLLAGDPQTFANNVLVVIAPASNPGNIQTLQDLGRPGVRFVMTNSQVPVGAYTLQVLDSLSKEPGYGAEFAQRVAAQVKTIPIPDANNVIAAYPIAVVKDARQAELAQRFVQLVLSDAGQTTIAKWGLRRAR